MASTKGIRLGTWLNPLPPLLADASRTRQIFDSLISNALKFTPSGGSIEVLSGVADGCVRVEVRDTGRGSAPEILPFIFERGRQATSAEQGGLSLGLTVASYLARAHGGEIAAESNGHGQGASFIVTFPLA